jgi:hypothetical protein
MDNKNCMSNIKWGRRACNKCRKRNKELVAASEIIDKVVNHGC